MAANYTIERTTEGVLIARNNIPKRPFIVVEGLCAADPIDVGRPRDIQGYNNHVLAPCIASGEIADGTKGPFDDRKMRFHAASITPSGLEIALGHSHYAEYMAQLDLKKEKIEELKDRGINEFGEEFAFFARAPGVVSVVRTSDGALIIGEREIRGQTDVYSGQLMGLAGHLAYRGNPILVNIEDDARREANEEAGIKLDEMKGLTFMGLFSNSLIGGADLDFGYLLETTLPSKYFTSGDWRGRVKKPEHREFVAVRNYDDLRQLLETGTLPGTDGAKKVIYNTSGVLAQISPEDMKEQD